jgi:hypothetical protein
MTVILAHGLGGRARLPVPLGLCLVRGSGGRGDLVHRAGAFWEKPSLEGRVGGWVLPPPLQTLLDAWGTRRAARAVATLLFAAVVMVSVLGRETSATNPAPTWVYVWFWVGLVPASLLLGPVWRLHNPLCALSGSSLPENGREAGTPCSR